MSEAAPIIRVANPPYPACIRTCDTVETPLDEPPVTFFRNLRTPGVDNHFIAGMPWYQLPFEATRRKEKWFSQC